MSEDTMVTGFIILMIVIIVLCYMAKVAQETKDAKEEKSKQTAPLAVQPIAENVFVIPVTSQIQTTQSDNAELIAVISAAIAAISGSTTVQVLSIRSGGKAWVVAGRQGLMNEF